MGHGVIRPTFGVRHFCAGLWTDHRAVREELCWAAQWESMSRHSLIFPPYSNYAIISSQRECYDWISTCSYLMSDIKGRRIRLLSYEEAEKLLGEEVFTSCWYHLVCKEMSGRQPYSGSSPVRVPKLQHLSEIAVLHPHHRLPKGLHLWPRGQQFFFLPPRKRLLHSVF